MAPHPASTVTLNRTVGNLYCTVQYWDLNPGPFGLELCQFSKSLASLSELFYFFQQQKLLYIRVSLFVALLLPAFLWPPTPTSCIKLEKRVHCLDRFSWTVFAATCLHASALVRKLQPYVNLHESSSQSVTGRSNVLKEGSLGLFYLLRGLFEPEKIRPFLPKKLIKNRSKRKLLTLPPTTILISVTMMHS